MTDDGTDLHALSRAELITLVESTRLAASRDKMLRQTAPIGILESTPDGVITSANTALGAMLGYRCEDLVGTSAAALADPVDAPAIQASVQGLLAGRVYSAQRHYC